MKSVGISAAIVAASFYGAINWKPVNTLSEANAIRVAAQSIAVGVQDHGDGTQSRCNYWVINQEKQYVMANGHCVEDPNKAQNLRIKFTDSTKWINCPTVVAYSQWELLDYVVVRCDAELPEALPIDARPVEQFEKLVHVSHNCNYYPVGGDTQCQPQAMYDASEDCQVLNYRTKGGLEFMSGCDALGGSSGSPYLSRFPNEDGKLEVVGLYHSAHFYSDARGWDEGRGEGNYAVRIDIVMKELEIKGIFDKDTVDKPVEHVDNRSPITIIFDSLWIIIKNILILFKA